MDENILKQEAEKCLQSLQQEGLIYFPTETGWCLGCDATNKSAVSRILEASANFFIDKIVVLVADENDVLKYTAAPDLALFDYLQNAERPTSVLFQHALGLAENIVNENGSVVIRICNSEFCRYLIKRFRKPIASLVYKNFLMKEGIDYWVKENEKYEFKETTFIKWENGKPIEIKNN